MGRDYEVKIFWSQSELDLVAAAAQQIGMELTSFVRHTALALAGDMKPQQYGKYELNSIYREAASRGHVWGESELRERGLPLYWSESWVRARLAEGKTANQLAILSGSHQRTVQHHIRVVHGIQSFRTLTDADIETISTRFAAGVPRREIAADLGVSNVTVGFHLKRNLTEREGKPLVVKPPSPETPVKPNIQGLRDWSERLFAERAASLTWPTATETIADALFGGDRATARLWTSRMVKKGRLRRITRGWFELA